MAEKRPNIVIFNPDQWRGDVMGHLGNPAAVTPTLDRLVETEAVSFSGAYCQNPVCTPSRCSFMTGWYPHVRGHRTMFHMLQPDEPMLLRTLKEAGYYVWWGGKNDVVPAQNGFDDYCDVKYKPPLPVSGAMNNLHADSSWRGGKESDSYYSFYVGKLKNDWYDSDWAMVEGAIDLIRNPPRDKPLCIYLPLLYPHPPYGVEDPWYSQIDRAKLLPRHPTPHDWSKHPSMLKGIYERQHMQTWTEDRWDELRATYYGMCARVDTQFGRVLAALREVGIYDNTAVFFFSDHGDFTGDYGLVEKTQNTFEECLVNVPFIVKPPKGVPIQPGVRDALVELIDMPATVEALTGLTPKHTHFGRSLLPLIAGTTHQHRDAVFCEGGRLQGETQAMENEAPTDEDFLYWPRLSWQRGDGPEHSKAVMCRTKDYKYVYRLYEGDELYDLKTDPRALHNRIDDPAFSDIKAEMGARTLRFMVETADAVPHTPDRRG